MAPPPAIPYGEEYDDQILGALAASSSRLKWFPGGNVVWKLLCSETGVSVSLQPEYDQNALFEYVYFG